MGTKSGGQFLNSLSIEGLTTSKEIQQGDNNRATINSINKIVTAPSELYNSILSLLNA